MTSILHRANAAAVTALSRGNAALRLYTPAIAEHCFIIGAMKSGTTALYGYLSQHPAIAPNLTEKEPEFFSQPEAFSPAAATGALAAYRRQWLPRPFARRIALEASTGYSKRPRFPDAAARLARLPARKHLIYILRNPIARAESHLAHNAALGRGRDPAAAQIADLEHAAAVSRYASQLDAYRSAMPDTPVKLVDFERFQRDTAAVLAELCAFMEIDVGFEFAVAPAPERSHGLRLPADQRRRLHAMLAEDMAALSARYGVDVARWGF